MGWYRWIVVGVVIVGVVLGMGCAGPPRYVRGDLQSTALTVLPARASVSVKPTLVGNPVDAAIRERIDAALARSEHPVVDVRGAELLVGYRHTTSGQTSSRYESDGFEAIWREFEPLACPDRFWQHLSVAVASAEAGRPTRLLWVGELCSDGAGQPAEIYVGTFAGEILRSLGMNRAPKRFEFLVTERATAPTVAPPVVPRLPDAGNPPAVPDVPSTPTNSLPMPPAEDTAAPRPGATTSSPPVPPLPPLPEIDSADELSAPGPTWSAATEACAQLDQRPDVACTLVVEVASGRPVLQIGYGSEDILRSHSSQDVAAVGPSFCRAANDHGLLDVAVLRLRSPAGATDRDCASLAR